MPLESRSEPNPPEVDGRVPRRRRRRILTIVLSSIAACVVVAIIAFTVWANTTFPAASGPLARALADPGIEVEISHDTVIMHPDAAPSGRGLVFLAGAKVEPDAYVATFRDLVASGTTVVIVRPTLNLAILETRPLEAFTALAPDVTSWAVGGHSQGGVKACTYASSPDVSALILLGSYCASTDLSARQDLAVLSVSGSADRLVSQEDIAAAAHLLPSDAEFIELDGVSHAQFGSYGEQPGDGRPAVTDAVAQTQITDALNAVIAEGR